MSRTEILFSFRTTLEDFLDDMREREQMPEEELREMFRGVRSLLSLEHVLIGDDQYRLVKVNDADMLRELFGLGDRIVIQRKSEDDPWEVAGE